MRRGASIWAGRLGQRQARRRGDRSRSCQVCVPRARVLTGRDVRPGNTSVQEIDALSPREGRHGRPTEARYEPASPEDGYRVLIDRLWPAGVSRQQAELDDWEKELSPSAGLRQWFGHEPRRFEEFRRRYIEELRNERPRLTALRRRAREAHAHARLLRPGHRAQRRRRPRGGPAAGLAEGSKLRQTSVPRPLSGLAAARQVPRGRAWSRPGSPARLGASRRRRRQPGC